MASKNDQSVIDLTKMNKFSFAKLKKLKAVHVISKIAIYFLLICIGFVYLEPIFEMISKSIMSAKDLIDPSITWIAKHFTLSNFKEAANTLDVSHSLINSIWVSALFALGQTIVSATTGFALSRYSFKGKGLWFGMIVLAFILPVPLLTVPRIIMLDSLNTAIGVKLIGTIIPQLLMSILGQGTYSTILILIFYNFFNMIPKSLDEAAMIDGATILVVFMFAFVFNWNETYSTSTLMRNSIELVPNQLTLFDNNLTTSDVGSVNEASKMAATLISIAPLLLLYALVQRQFIEGIENAGITGE